MYPSPFTYHRPTSLAEAQRLLASMPGARLLAGGHSLLPMMKLRLATPEALIDLARIPELRGVVASASGLRIGALTTHAAIASSGEVRGACAVLAETAARIGDPAVRNRGTIGGSLAHADPGADYPTVLVALGATIEITGAGGARSVPADRFFEGLMATALVPGDVLTAVLVPAAPGGSGAAYTKFAHPASRYAVIGAAAQVTIANGACAAARVAVGGVVPRAQRLPSVEAALAGQALEPAVITAAANRSAADLGDDLVGDVFASAEYRREVAAVHVARAIGDAAARAR